ncbi:MAG TPA: hypothetical protein VG984_02040 [Candidatus Paceibacterota bacterium]|nr:hypothetical protein [Candidatus Paceibacterota bacterium]
MNDEDRPRQIHIKEKGGFGAAFLGESAPLLLVPQRAFLCKQIHVINMFRVRYIEYEKDGG